MKNNYTFKLLLTFILTVSMLTLSNAQIRLKIVNPSTGAVTIHNYGSSTVNIGTYWLCNFPSYDQLNTLTVTQGSLNLAAGAEVTVISTVNLTVADSELGLYNSSTFGSSTAMQDYLQWGSAGHQREVVAVNKGIWVAGTFVSAAAPFEYIGNGAQNGATFWDTFLSVEDYERENSFFMHPNPSDSMLNIELRNGITNANLEVYNLLGKQILTRDIKSENGLQLNISNWDSGMYLVKVTSDKRVETKRVIKQ